MSDLTQLEKAVMDKLLAGNQEVLVNLRKQLQTAKVAERVFTGVGFYTNFAIDEALAIPLGSKRIAIGDVHADVPGTNGIGFTLFIENGLLSQLEGYTFSGEWPVNISDFKLKYDRDHRTFGPLSPYL